MATKTEIDPRITTNPEGDNEPQTERNLKMYKMHKESGVGVNSLVKEFGLSRTRVQQILDHEAARAAGQHPKVS